MYISVQRNIPVYFHSACAIIIISVLRVESIETGTRNRATCFGTRSKLRSGCKYAFVRYLIAAAGKFGQDPREFFYTRKEWFPGDLTERRIKLGWKIRIDRSRSLHPPRPCSPFGFSMSGANGPRTSTSLAGPALIEPSLIASARSARCPGPSVERFRRATGQRNNSYQNSGERIVVRELFYVRTPKNVLASRLSMTINRSLSFPHTRCCKREGHDRATSRFEIT